MIVCNPILNIPNDDFYATSNYISEEENRTYYKHIYAYLYTNVSFCQYVENGYQQMCTKAEGWWDGFPKTLLVYLPKSGIQSLSISFLLKARYSGSNILDNVVEYTLIQYTGNVPVKSKDEISNQQRERNYQLIIALFALFTIFTAVYHLRKLWRDNGDKNKKK